MIVQSNQGPNTKDLRITYEKIHIPSADCNQPPSQLRQPDQCSVSVSVTDGKTTEVLNFARQGDQFVLSEKQGKAGTEAQRILWFNTGHNNTPQEILRVMTVLGKFLPTKAIAHSDPDTRGDNAAIPLLLSKYIVQGKAEDPFTDMELLGPELLSFLLKTYGDLTDSDMDFLAPTLDVLTVLLTDPQLTKTEIDRVAEILVVSRYKPPYKKLLQFILSYRIGKEPKVSDKELQETHEAYLEDLKSFLAQLVIAIDEKEKFPSNAVIVRAAFAFRELTGANLCDALQEFEKRGLGGDFPLGKNAIKQCRAVTYVPPKITASTLPAQSQQPVKKVSQDKVWRNLEIGLGAGGATLIAVGGGLSASEGLRAKRVGLALAFNGAMISGCSVGSLVRLSKKWKTDPKKHNQAALGGCIVGGILGAGIAGLIGGLRMRSQVPNEVAPMPEDPGQKNPVQETGP